MKKNMGTIDRSIRIIAGLALLGLAVTGKMWGLVGIVPLLTGIVGWCPPYQLLGINTIGSSCQKNK